MLKTGKIFVPVVQMNAASSIVYAVKKEESVLQHPFCNILMHFFTLQYKTQQS